MIPDSLFVDGGVVGVNPSPIGGTWAFAWVKDGVRIHGASGSVTPEEVGLPVVSNNVTELWAMVEGMESLPPEWAGQIYTDSSCTFWRSRKKGASMKGIPEALSARLCAARARLGDYTLNLLGGHPTRKDLARGARSDGLPVSPHNVWADKRCGEEAIRLKLRLKAKENQHEALH